MVTHALNPKRTRWLQLASATALTLASGFAAALSQPPPAPPAQNVAAAENAVHSLAQGCYALQSPTNGKFINRYHKGGAIDNGLGYQVNATSVESAAHFYFKPTSFFHFMLTDQDGRYLATHLPNEISAGRYAGSFAEFRVTAHEAGNGEYNFSLYGPKLSKVLRHNYGGTGHYRNGGLYVIDILNPTNAGSETAFKLVAQNDCKPFPEANLNADESISLKGDVNAPVRGAMDPHTHITSYEFMGGKFLHGEPFSRWGIETALRDSKEIHGPSGALDIIGNLMGFDNVNNRYDTRGYPDFPSWPESKSMSHMQYYYKWIERAHKGGLKMMTSLIVENEVLCNVQKTVNPASWINPNNCATTASTDLQIQRLNEMEAYIDAQQGGPGKGFFRLVTSPAEARQVIADGKMAVVMGIEASELFDCGIRDNCTKAKIESQLQKIHAAGVRTLYPTHKFDNQFGGARPEDGFINVGQWLATGSFFSAEQCDADTRGRFFKSGFPLIGDVPVIKDILNLIGLNPSYDESQPLCNTKGLSDLGVYLVNRMIDLGMIIEMDHMSTKTANSVMEIAKARNYSGVISSHSWLNSAADGAPHKVQEHIAELGGILAPYNSSSTSVQWGINRYLNLVEDTPFVNGVPFATDMGGIAGQAGARGDAASNPLIYPFVTEEGVQIDRQVTGNRVFDFNTDGMAHYGFVADHIQDIREQTPERIYDAVMNSAEAYLQMWERAEANTDSQYVNPFGGHYVSIVDRKSGKCMDIPGNDDQGANGTNVQLWDCQASANDQKWLYNKANQMFENKAFPGKCLDNRGQAHDNGGIVIWDCIDHNNLRWTYSGNKLASKHNGNIVADAFGTGNGANVGQWSYHGGANQQWELRIVNPESQWVDYRDARTGKCLDVTNGNNANGTKVQLAACNGSNAQQWKYVPSSGKVHSKIGGNKCLDVPGGQTGNGVQVQVWDCVADHNNQKFVRVGESFRPQLAPGQALDAAGEGNGAPVIFHGHHGGANQIWRGALN